MLPDQVTEEFSTARETLMARRDMRSGQQRARARVDADGALRIDIAWDSPYAGVRGRRATRLLACLHACAAQSPKHAHTIQ